VTGDADAAMRVDYALMREAKTQDAAMRKTRHCSAAAKERHRGQPVSAPPDSVPAVYDPTVPPNRRRNRPTVLVMPCCPRLLRRLMIFDLPK
jgi:hypothetical protein